MGSNGNVKSLVLPGGGFMSLNRDQVTISRTEMMQFANFHETAHRLKLAVVCPQCDQSIEGSNDGNGRIWSVRCGCREFRADMGGNGTVS